MAEKRRVAPNPAMEKTIALAEKIANEEGVSPALVRSMIQHESSGRANAVSKKGAQGLMQVMPGTAAELGFKPGDMLDPEKNVRAGVRYLKQMLEMFDGDERLAVAAYNAGPGAVRKAGGVPNNKETPSYVDKVLSTFKSLAQGKPPGSELATAESAQDISGPTSQARITSESVSGEASDSEIGVTELATSGPDTGDGSELEAQQPATEAAGKQPSRTDALLAPDTDKLLMDLWERVNAPREAEAGKAEPMTGGMRFAAGIIAAMNPELYNKIVVPELERRGETAARQALLEETARSRDISAIQSLASLQSSIAQRETATAQREEQLGLNERRVQVAEENSLLRKQEREQRLAGAQQTVAGFQSEIENLVGEVTPVIEMLAGSGEPHKQSRADSLARQVTGLGGLLGYYNKNLEAVTPETVQMLGRQIDAMRKSNASALEAEAREATRREAAAQRISIKMVQDYNNTLGLMDVLDKAKPLIKLGVGGPFENMLPRWQWTGGEARQDLEGYYSDLNLENLPERVGVAISASDKLLAAGIRLDVSDNYTEASRKILIVEGILNRTLKSIDKTFRQLGIPSPGAFGYADRAEVDSLPAPSGFSPGTMTMPTGQEVFRMSGNAYDLWVVEEIPDGEEPQ